MVLIVVKRGKMAEITTQEIKDFLNQRQGKELSLMDIRKEKNILPGTKSFDAVRNIMFQLEEQKIVKSSGKRDGIYKVIRKVQPVSVFGVERERRPLYPLIFPKDYTSKEEMLFARDVVIREGDLILISGVSNYGKTTLCMNFCGENIGKSPILMGNEYTQITETGYDVSPRFLARLDTMNVTNPDGTGWVDWVDVDGNDKFVLLPVRDDYAEHIVKNRMNIVDWINIETGEHYMIGTILEGMKKASGRGVTIAAIQKGTGMEAGRGGQFTKDFADLEILIDKFGESEVLLTLGKVKESLIPLTGKTYAYSISQGVKIHNFREVKRCPACHGTGYTKQEKCSMCWGNKFVDLEKGERI